MPLLRFDLVAGRTPAEVRALLDAAHAAVVSVVENADADWSFGHGRAQFLTGEL